MSRCTEHFRHPALGITFAVHWCSLCCTRITPQWAWGFAVPHGGCWKDTSQCCGVSLMEMCHSDLFSICCCIKSIFFLKKSCFKNRKKNWMNELAGWRIFFSCTFLFSCTFFFRKKINKIFSFLFLQACSILVFTSLFLMVHATYVQTSLGRPAVS